MIHCTYSTLVEQQVFDRDRHSYPAALFLTFLALFALLGDPKGIQHPTGGHAVVNRWTMKALYGME